jgi:hypothetical protein
LSAAHVLLSHDLFLGELLPLKALESIQAKGGTADKAALHVDAEE